MSWRNLVWNQAEEFRKSHSCVEMDSLPIDSLTIADLELGLNLIPFHDLRSRFRIEAALSADFTSIYVDAEIFDLIDTAPEWKLNRLRFSIAHEIGHFVLHREEFQREGFKSVETFFEWTASLGGRKYDIEKEANEFAGRLLVPREQLENEFNKVVKPFDDSLPSWRSNSELRRQITEHIAPKFGVAPEVISVRFCREDFWPDPSIY